MKLDAFRNFYMAESSISTLIIFCIEDNLRVAGHDAVNSELETIRITISELIHCQGAYNLQAIPFIVTYIVVNLHSGTTLIGPHIIIS